MSPAMRPPSAPGRGLRLFVLFIGMLGFALTAHAQERSPIVFPNTQYEPVDWADLEGWDTDDHAIAFAAFLTSCRTLDANHRREQDLTAIPSAMVCAGGSSVSGSPCIAWRITG